uniref:Wall-associated receptor kinase-like 16 n=1 Tax=Nelumbo nucifera TaxID=4432 RepID=A0A822ZBW6_NELNU|nr:TPA_asm: hypothetical protein HUJ06_000852 [Nelumbo nucifera]
MALVGMLLLQLLLWWPPTTAISISSSSSVAMVKPHCKGKCWNVTVPYPFGLDDDPISCYREGFKLNCSTTLDPPQLYIGNTEVLEMSLLPAQLRVLNYIGYDCYNSTDNDYDFPSFNVSARPFTFSDTGNRFTVIGCDNYARITGLNGRNFTSGCSMICNDQQSGFINGSCSGIGCCQTSIPKGLKSFKLYIDSYNNHTDVSDFNPCAYAFLVDSEWYNFSVSDLRGYKDFYNRNRQNVPMVLDWAIENYPCENVSRSDPSYACRNNSECFNSPNGRGYLCNCSLGYQGNPYLDDGCQDVDECADPATNECKAPLAICTNMPGGYNCSCPDGMDGDGRKSGSGCTAHPKKQSAVMEEVALGVGLGIVMLLAIYWLYGVLKKRHLRRRKEIFFERNGGLLLQEKILSNETSFEKLKVFTAKELENATDYYNEDRILGRGGQGTVYKGMLADGRIVAVKKVKIVDENRLKQFINEIVILSQINHRNVVKLFGCCLDAEFPLLIYEFISGGNLAERIHEKNKDLLFSWNIRLKIATEIASAVAYLHSAASIPIYYRDIKSSSILLDEKYTAKVSDFGISRLVENDKTHLTTSVQGTFGYFDPEYFQSYQFTEKSDVFSFGVVLLELLTVEKTISSSRSSEDRCLVTYFASSVREDHFFKILDPQIKQEGKTEELQAVANLAMRCLNTSGRERPTMMEVASELERLRRSDEPSVVPDNGQEVEIFINETLSL